MDVRDQLIWRMDFEETRSYLVIDYPDKFQFVYKENFDNWEISEQEAFELALCHVGEYEVEIGKRDFDPFSHFSFFSSTHSVSFILDFDKNASICIGRAGSIVNIPTQGSAFAIPIDKSNIAEMMCYQLLILRLFTLLQPWTRKLNHPQIKISVLKSSYVFHNSPPNKRWNSWKKWKPCQRYQKIMEETPELRDQHIRQNGNPMGWVQTPFSAFRAFYILHNYLIKSRQSLKLLEEGVWNFVLKVHSSRLLNGGRDFLFSSRLRPEFGFLNRRTAECRSGINQLLLRFSVRYSAVLRFHEYYQQLAYGR